MKFPAFEPINLKTEDASFEVIDIPLEKIEPDKNQPRKSFNDGALEELALSIKQHGVIQPILVRDVESGKKYEIIAGERRFRAAQIAGLKKIPAIIKEYSIADKMAIALIENIQRENLNPLEEAQAIQTLLNECCMTHGQVAETLGKSRTTVTNLLRLLGLEAEVKEMINSGSLDMGHAKVLLVLSREEQLEVANLIIKNSLSVREAEKLIRKLNIGEEIKTPIFNQEFQRKAEVWKKKISQELSSKIDISFNNKGKGKLVFHFNSIHEANALMENLGISEIEEK